MNDLDQAAAALALAQMEDESWPKLAREVRDCGDAYQALERRGHLQEGLFGDGPPTEAVVDQYIQLLTDLSDRGVQAIAISSARFPLTVAQLQSPPLLLFFWGTLSDLDRTGVAIIGSRRVSNESLTTTRSWASEISNLGAVVVSGLAAGVDRQAHLGALDVGGRTVAVIGTGIDRVYPKENAALQEEIATSHLLVSQFMPDAPPTKRSFPMRNAVMAAWTRATLVIDADDRSGAALQARLAAEQGRHLYLHHRLRSHLWANKFVDAGKATFVQTPEDVVANS